MQKRPFSALQIGLGILIVGSLLVSCTRKSEPVVAAPASTPTSKIVKVEKQEAPKDRILQSVIRAFEQADSVHREAWWVVAGERRPFGKSPFGKVQRALMASLNLKLANKSAFRCDRYVVQRDVLSALGYPQRAEVFEKCSEKSPAKKMADWSLEKVGEIKVTFYTDGLEEVLGLGATVMGNKIECRLEFNDADQLTVFDCKNWAQERSATQLVRLETYTYFKDKKSLLKLRGKVHENLTEIRKIEVDIPLEGKIKVTETELYAPEEPKAEVKPNTAAAPGAQPVAAPGNQSPAPKTLVQEPGANRRAPLPGAPQQQVDPDIMIQQQRAEEGLPPGVTLDEEGNFVQGEEGEMQQQAAPGGPGLQIDDNTGEVIPESDPQEGHSEDGEYEQDQNQEHDQQQEGVPRGR